MSKLPVARTKVEFAGQVRPDTASAPKLRIIVLGFPCFGGRPEEAHILRQRPDLLSVAVGASFPSIDNPAPLLGGAETCHGHRCRLFDFTFQLIPRNDRKNKK